MRTVAIFGAGVAGLSAAHEFVKLGYKVSVYEANAEAGGFFRSARRAEDGNMPTEYSWHGFGPWYHNAFDVMKQIPFDGLKSVYDRALSRPVNYGVVPDRDTGLTLPAIFKTPLKFRFTALDTIRWSKLLFQTWSANLRTEKWYSALSASEAWKPRMTELGWKTWRATFGPWVGVDWTRASLHHVGQFFRRNMQPGTAHEHEADEEGPAWKQGAGEGWLLLRGPSNEVWFDKWIPYLKEKGAQFFFETALTKFLFDGRNISSAVLDSGVEVTADIHVLAVNPFAAAEIISQTPALAVLDELRLFRPLTNDGPHTQVSFRIAFSEEIKWPEKMTAILLPDSEFNLTVFAQEQAWMPQISLGDGIKSLWTGTACVGTQAPGRVYGLPLDKCTREQFIEEVKTQLLECQGLDYLLKQANNGKSLKDFPEVRIEVWHEWEFSPQGIESRQKKWVMSTHTQQFLPNQKTPVPNLLLAGAHTKTSADIWSIEGAVESGRRAAQAIESSVAIIPQFKPLWLRVFGAIDDVCFTLGLPHFIDVFLILVALAVILLALSILT